VLTTRKTETIIIIVLFDVQTTIKFSLSVFLYLYLCILVNFDDQNIFFKLKNHNNFLFLAIFWKCDDEDATDIFSVKLMKTLRY